VSPDAAQASRSIARSRAAAIRWATPDDVGAIVEVAWADESPGGRFQPSDAFRAYYDHLVRIERVAVAEIEAGIAGFGAAVDTGRSRHLADLFVRRERQGAGLGRRLLEAVMGEAQARTTFASADPRALPIYVRAGMTALWPNLYLDGDAARLPAPPGYAVEPIAFETLAAVEPRWTGADRTRELAYWRRLPDPRPFGVSAGGRLVAVGLSRGRIVGRGRWIDRAVVAPDAEPLPALLAALAAAPLAAAARRGALGACVPGPSSLVRALLDAGFRITDRDIFLASDPDVVDPAREIMNTGFL